MTLVASADAAFGVHRDRKSHTGTLLWLGPKNAPISTRSSKQKLVTRSSTEAELVAANEVVQDVIWIRGILNELGYLQSKPTTVEQDNKSCMIMANRGSGGTNSRAVDIKFFWITEQVNSKSVSLEYVESLKIVADGLTKPLSPKRFEEWRTIVLNHCRKGSSSSHL